jgi:DNA mismatch endonuclease (patch repair protein)
MNDVPEPLITDTRRSLMSRIKGSDTKPEIMLRKALWSLGIRFRLGNRIGRLRPDLVFKGARLAIYVDGCFWHGCPEHYTPPRSRQEFWSDKLRENVERDMKQTVALQTDGWRVLRLWEHAVVEDAMACARLVEGLLKDHSLRPQLRTTQVIGANPCGRFVELTLINPQDCHTEVITRDLITAKPGRAKSDSL